MISCDLIKQFKVVLGYLYFVGHSSVGNCHPYFHIICLCSFFSPAVCITFSNQNLRVLVFYVMCCNF